ncbi:hypothetical protein F4824DRAFT_461116 [Ustulina deusta]|nr:hypothetical protein F4823DRAFT_444751 [Ustulina deusta]KAI3338094.1 hypothetical protein F4824DRAFT_461116 [Ustulina deusta]
MESDQLGSPLSEAPLVSPSASNESTPPAQKRKAPHEYSTNANTLRVRQRNAKLTPYRRAVERAKSNDLKAVSTAWKARIKSESFQEVSESMKQTILEEIENDVMNRRRLKKIDADSKIAALNQQYLPGNTVPAPPSGVLANSAAAKAVPPMAPPGYVPFPAQVIPDLMVASKDTPPQHTDPTTPASAVTRDEGRPVQPMSAAPADPMTSSHNPQIGAAIDRLEERFEAENRHFKEEFRRLDAGMQEIRGIMGTLMQQLDALIQARRMPTPYYATPHPMPHPTYTPTLTYTDTPPRVQEHTPSCEDGYPKADNAYNYSSDREEDNAYNYNPDREKTWLGGKH